MNQIYEEKKWYVVMEVMVWTSLIYDHHLTFMCDLDFQPTDQMFQMALLHVKENKCAKWFEIHA